MVSFSQLKKNTQEPIIGNFSHHWEEYGLESPEDQDIFNIDDHPLGRVYTNSKREFHYPSATTIISKVDELEGNKGWLEEWRKRVGDEEADRIVEEAMKLGTNMHNCAEKYMLNQSVPRDDLKAFNLFKKLKPELDNVEGVIFCEHALVSHRLKIAGRIDLFALMYSGFPEVVVDFKSSRRDKDYGDISGYNIQTTLYQMMIHEMTGIQSEIGAILMVVWNNGPPYLKTFDVIFNQYREQALELVAKYHETVGNEFDLEKQKEFFLG